MEKNQKIIIFSGADKSGKSTIAKALSADLNIPVFKVQRNKYLWDPMVSLIYGTEMVTQFIEQSGVSIILDRWHDSDFAYSRLFNRDISYRKIWEIDERMAKLGALMVVCYKSPEHFEHDKEDEAFIDETKYEEYTNQMRMFAMDSKCKILFLDTSDRNLESQLKAIKELL